MGVKGNALGHGKVGEYVESSAKTVVSYRRYEKRYEQTLRTLSRESSGPKLTSHHPGEDSMKEIYRRSNTTR